MCLGCMQAPVIMDQALLKGGEGNATLLARIMDARGCWLCLQKMHRKLGISVSRHALGAHG